MKFSSEIPIAFFFTFAAAALGASFQLGYFQNVGMPFISLASIADWLFTCAAIFPFAIFAYVAVDYLKPWLEKHLERGSFGNTPAYAILASIFPFILLLFVFAELHPDWTDAVMIVFRLYLVLWLMFTAIPAIYSVVKAINTNNAVKPGLALYVVLHLSVLQFFVGALYAKTPSAMCRFYLSEGSSEVAEYLRYLGEGYLVRADNQVQLISKTGVRKVVCGDEGDKPTASTKRLKVEGLLV